MRRQLAILGPLLAVAALATGCGGGPTEANARMLVEPTTWLRKLAPRGGGSGGPLVKLGQISRHERIMGLGIEIDVWVIKARPPGKKDKRTGPKGTVVLLHPLMFAKSWFYPLGKVLARRGWDVVLPDLRAHGSSGGDYITWGAKEKHDIEMVMSALVADNVVSDRIYAFGASLGGMIAIQYAAIDPRCRGVMALSPPASLERIGRRMLPLETRRDFEDALWRAGALGGFDPHIASAEAAAGRLACPLILAHGVLDVLVPYSHSRSIYKAAREPKKLIPLPLQGHDAGFGQEWWIAGQIEKLPEMAKLPRTPRPQERVTPADIEDFDEEAELEKLKRLEAIEKMLKDRDTRKRGPKYE